jgi:hypothetical protein
MSPMDRIKQHLREHGLTPVPEELRDDLHLVGLRFELARSQGHDVKLSAYLEVLLGMARDEARACDMALHAAQGARA